MRQLVLAIALAGSFALIGSIADAASTGEANSAVADSERAKPCEKRVDGVLRTIGLFGRKGRQNVSCRKAKKVMKRYILHKALPGNWECRSIPSLGKCSDDSPPWNIGEDLRNQPRFNFAPAQRA